MYNEAGRCFCSSSFSPEKKTPNNTPTCIFMTFEISSRDFTFLYLAYSHSHSHTHKYLEFILKYDVTSIHIQTELPSKIGHFSSSSKYTMQYDSQLHIVEFKRSNQNVKFMTTFLNSSILVFIDSGVNN